VKQVIWNAFIIVVLLAPGFGQTITIGFTVSKTGALNVDSQEQYRGFELWRDQVNAAGGIKAGGKSYKVQFNSYDDESSSRRVQQLYKRMILEDKVNFLFSPYSSNLTARAAVVTEQYGKIMLTTGAAERNAYTHGNHYLFQMFAPDSEYLKVALDALKAKDPKATVAFVYEDTSFSVAAVTSANAYARQLGFNVVFSEAYAPNTTDLSAIIDKVIASKATALLAGGHYADGSSLARQLYVRQVPLKMLTLASDSPQQVNLGDAALGVTVPSQWEPQSTFKVQYGPSGPKFVKAYAAKYNAPPTYESAGAYAAGLILQRAIEEAGSIDPPKVAQALNATDVTTFYGHTKFSSAPTEHGLQVGHQMVLALWQKDESGKLAKEVVWPFGKRSKKKIGKEGGPPAATEPHEEDTQESKKKPPGNTGPRP
jgi:branched-chain amino acid transport system substrate-binding protein